MQEAGSNDRMRALLRAYVGRDGEVGDSRAEHLRRLLVVTERKVLTTHGQFEDVNWGAMLSAIQAELSTP